MLRQKEVFGTYLRSGLAHQESDKVKSGARAQLPLNALSSIYITPESPAGEESKVHGEGRIWHLVLDLRSLSVHLLDTHLGTLTTIQKWPRRGKGI